MIYMPHLIKSSRLPRFCHLHLAVGDWDTERLLAIGSHTAGEWLRSDSEPGLLDSKAWLLTSSFYHINTSINLEAISSYHRGHEKHPSWVLRTKFFTPPQRSHTSMGNRHAPWWSVAWRGSWKHRGGSSNTTRGVRNIPKAVVSLSHWVLKDE